MMYTICIECILGSMKSEKGGTTIYSQAGSIGALNDDKHIDAV